MEEEDIDVGTYDSANPEPGDVADDGALVDFQCEICKWVGKSDRSLSAHKRHNHPDQVKPKETPTRSRGRPRRQEYEEDANAVTSPRVTTKELLGGRKRPKTVVDASEDSILRTNQEAARLHALGLVDPETPIGDFLRNEDRYAMMEDDMDPEDMVVGEEVVIGDDVMSVGFQRRYGPRRFKLAPRITVGDPEGKYKCYVETCAWRGGYRSVRMDHMRSVHPDWKMPSRYLLERISKDNVYIDPKDHKPQFACEVEGCEWRGNYRASRSAHMRKVHPEEHEAKKKTKPGYNSTGTYPCHHPTCTWRGWSRSTRSAHLKKVHPEWRPEDTRVLFQIVLSCFHCKASFNSYPLLVEHLVNHGGVGLHVDETFDSRDEFSKWMHRIEALYCMTFERHDPLLTGEFTDAEHEQNVYYLHCSVGGSRAVQLANDARTYTHATHCYLKRRQHHLMTRQKNDCSAHLEVREDPEYGTINVKGTLEHTGHRFGTPLLRMLPLERQLFCDVLNWKGDERNREILALDMLDRINANEGFTMDNYGPGPEVPLLNPVHSDQIVSIREIVTQSDQEYFFGVKFDDVDPRKMRFGYQTLEMQKLWGRYGTQASAIIDTCLLDFHNLCLFQYTVIVIDENNTPKCAMLYLSSEQDGSPEIILERLVHVDPRGPKVFVLDPSEVWVPLMEKYYGSGDPEKPKPVPEALISEWSLMDYWACKVQQYTDNEMDAFCIVSALRRALRYDDPFQMHAFFVELFEAFYESGYDALASFFDAQLTDLEYLKRWTPLRRQGYTAHLHPLLSTSSKLLRGFYLGLEDIGRVDQWFSRAIKRLEHFNSVELSSPFTHKHVELPRKFYYGLMTPDGQEIVPNPLEDPENPQANTEGAIIYEDGEEIVVEEEVIHLEEGEEIIYEEVEIPMEYQQNPQQNPPSESQETTSKEGGEAVKTEEEEEPEQKSEDARILDSEQRRIREQQEKRDLAQHQRQQRPPSQLPLLHARPSPQQPKIPPHRLNFVNPATKSAAPSATPTAPPEPLPLLTGPVARRTRTPSQRQQSESEASTSASTTTSRRRDTTKSVVRNRRKRDRFADLRNCPPDIMRAIAAHAISYDGRRKEQRPFQFAPEQAKMAQSPLPAPPTAAMRQYEGAQKMQEQQQNQLRQQQQRREFMRKAAAASNRWDRDEMDDDEEMEQFQRPSTSSNPRLHHGHPIHHPRQNLPPRPTPPHRQRGVTFVPPHRRPPGTHPHRPPFFQDPRYPPRRFAPRYEEEEEEEEEEDVVVDVEEIEEVVVAEEQVTTGGSQYYEEEIYQEDEEEEVDVVDDQQPCTSASLYR